MEGEAFSPEELAWLAVSVFLGIMVLYWSCCQSTPKDPEVVLKEKEAAARRKAAEDARKEKERKEAERQAEALKQERKEKKKKEKEREKKGKKDAPTNQVSKLSKRRTKKHPLEAKAIKGHTDDVTSLSFSSDGRYLLTASADRSCQVFLADTVFKSGASRSFRCHVDLDHLMMARFSSDSSFFVGGSANSADLLLFGINHNALDDKEAEKIPLIVRIPRAHPNEELCGVGVGVSGRYMFTATTKTALKVWGRGGKLLQDINTNLLKQNMATMSPDGRFIAIAAFAGCPIYEVILTKTGDYVKTEKVMDLTGHKSGVRAVSFGADSKTVVTASKDGTCKVWNIDVRYHVSEDPKCTTTFSTGEDIVDICSLSPDMGTVATVSGNNIRLFRLTGGKAEELEYIEAAHDTRIIDFSWSADSKRFATAAQEKHAKLWNTPSV